MPEAWSAAEVAATVADYLSMLEAELRGEPCNKAEHNRHLQALLNERSGPAIEFKHANISAVLIELGIPYIAGYKPRGNYRSCSKRRSNRAFKQTPGLRWLSPPQLMHPSTM